MSADTAPAAMPGEEERFAAAYLGFNPHDASTWDADIVKRLVRIRSERGDQAFVQEVASLMTPASIHNPHNACCYREQCKALEARALAAEAALAAANEALEPFSTMAGAYDGFLDDEDAPALAQQGRRIMLSDLRRARGVAAAIRAEGE